MDITEMDISTNGIFHLTISAFVLFIIFRIINYIFRVFKNKSSFVKSISQYVSLVEMFAWIIFLIWAATFFIKKNQMLALGVFAILLFVIFWISTYSLSNIIAGVLFKFQGNYSIGDFISTKDYSGKIQKFAFISIQIETKEGQSVFIPYRKLINEVNTRFDSETSEAGYHFKVKTSKDENIDDIAERMKSMLLNMPWISTKKIPQIKQVGMDANSYTFEINLFAINNKYALKTENEILKEFGIKEVN